MIGKLTIRYGKSLSLIGKSTISDYFQQQTVGLPEGSYQHLSSKCPRYIKVFSRSSRQHMGNIYIYYISINVTRINYLLVCFFGKYHFSGSFIFAEGTPKKLINRQAPSWLAMSFS
jgi:hypothetical protein